MSHVTEKNIIIVDCDLLIHECIIANEGEKAFVYIISPFMSDFKIPRSVVRFVSNLVSISDVEFYSDLIRLLCDYGGEVCVLTRSPANLQRTNLSTWFINRQRRLLRKFDEMGVAIKVNPALHAKATITSQGALVGSFNLTQSGRFFNIEAGNYFPNLGGKESKEYQEKLEWAKKIFEYSDIIDRDQL
mgnify:CR=1 FL=1